MKRSGDARRRADRGRRFAVLAAASLLAAACVPRYSEAPLARNFPVSAQHKPQSSAHWQAIADRLVLELKPAIGAKPVFIAPPATGEADFPQIFRRQLQSALLANGIKLVRENPSRGEQLVLDVSARLVRFSAERAQNRGFGGDPLAPEAARNATDSWYSGLYASGETPSYELVLTVSVHGAAHLVGQRTQAFYIADADRALYEFVPKEPPPQPPAPQLIPVKGGR